MSSKASAAVRFGFGPAWVATDDLTVGGVESDGRAWPRVQCALPEVAMASFDLRLALTYWKNGFFNVPVDFQRFVTTKEGPLDIYLGDSTQSVVGGRVSRSANRNATPRIYGNKALAEFIKAHWKVGDSVRVEFISLTAVRVGRGTAAAS